MIRRYLPACNRVISRIHLFIVLMAMVAVSGLSSQLFALQAQTTGPKIWLGERQQLPMQGAGAAATVTRPAGSRAAVLAGDAERSRRRPRQRRNSLYHLPQAM